MRIALRSSPNSAGSLWCRRRRGSPARSRGPGRLGFQTRFSHWGIRTSGDFGIADKVAKR